MNLLKSGIYFVAMLIIGIVFTASMNSCSKELEINAEWRDVTVIMGLLNQKDSMHYIKINKTFLGEESAFTMAQVKDSSEYENISAVVEQWKDDVKINSYPLLETTVSNKEPGVFYYPDQKIYYFQENALDYASKYKLVATINESKIVTAETELIDYIHPRGNSLNSWKNSGIPLYSGNEYKDPTFDVEVGKDARRIEVYIKFHYYDVYEDNTEVHNVVELSMGGYKTKTSNGGESIPITVSGEDFFKKIGEKIPTAESMPSTLKFRNVKTDVIEIFVVAGGVDLNTYMEVNEPTTGIVQQKEEYTNVTNGIGLFSSRFSEVFPDANGDYLPMLGSSLDELMGGNYTSEIDFCSTGIPVTDPRNCYYQ